MKTTAMQDRLLGLLAASILLLVTGAGMTAGLVAGAAWMHRENPYRAAWTLPFDPGHATPSSASPVR